MKQTLLASRISIGILSTFITPWTLMGSAFVYRAWEPRYQGSYTGDLWCNKTVYLLAFVTLTVMYVGILVYPVFWVVRWCVRTSRLWDEIVEIASGESQ